MDLAATRAALAARLATIPTVAAIDHVPDAVAIGVDQVGAVVFPGEVDYATVFGGGVGGYAVRVVLVTNRQHPASAQARLDLVLSWNGPGDTNSIAGVIKADRKLGGLAVDTTLLRASAPYAINIGDPEVPHLAVDLDLRIYWSR